MPGLSASAMVMLQLGKPRPDEHAIEKIAACARYCCASRIFVTHITSEMRVICPKPGCLSALCPPPRLACDRVRYIAIKAREGNMLWLDEVSIIQYQLHI